MTGATLARAREIASKRRELTERVKRALIERLSLQAEPDEIADDTPLFGVGLALDSVDALEIALVIEVEFNVKVSDSDLQSFRSINTLVDLIEERTAANGAVAAVASA